MKTRAWWNTDFEGLINSMRKWLEENPNIELVNVDWKFAQQTGQNQGKWWLLMFYKEPSGNAAARVTLRA